MFWGMGESQCDARSDLNARVNASADLREPILMESSERYTMFPIKFPEVRHAFGVGCLARA